MKSVLISESSAAPTMIYPTSSCIMHKFRKRSICKIGELSRIRRSYSRPHERRSSFVAFHNSAVPEQCRTTSTTTLARDLTSLLVFDSRPEDRPDFSEVCQLMRAAIDANDGKSPTTPDEGQQLDFPPPPSDLQLEPGIGVATSPPVEEVRPEDNNE